MARGTSRERGFTLLEVLIAFAIAALALAVMFDGVMGGLRATRTAQRYEVAVSLARSHLAEAAAGPLAARLQSGEDGGGYRWEVRVAPGATVAIPGGEGESATSATLFQLTAIVSWAGDGGRRQVRLDTARLAATTPQPAL